MSDGEDDRYRAPALDKGLDILELLAGVDGGLTQAEISKKLNRSPNEFYRMLDRLVRRGYITRIDGDRYSLTLKLFGLAQLHAPTRRLAAYATPLMRDLAQRTRQANQLAVFDRGSAVVIAQQEAPDYWGISIRVGSHISLFDTGSGHVLLAFRPPEEREMMISEHVKSRKDIELTPEFYARLDEIRARGYEMMASAQTAGVFNLSAPILGPDRRGIAALTVPYISLVNAPSAPDISTTISLLQKTAEQLSLLAGSDVQHEVPVET
ncbi:IclR family transcriptional regulator [Rhizobium sp. PP-F2F-G38]|uniref:IclR family transcriptional regulator n=1 Tax=Ferranicluibacter rubi TaxID=2715133 RepID=A0AA43ZJ16_9HYPH|nr:IclR family transcriptional regulator [Ferranicluibacter rubi]PYE34110.1 IclR family transcriptional regulator [Rhizobium sp. PP-WC-1G-195]PYE96746.1 IclR family transcriptional regulator [Rhizobium sp. PP-F2F-G38]TCP86158.1 IclR family transcriptional regulator [Rhizobium sp. PP-CC-2G-626]TCQ06044.1 IclR family transcriptional regulator [Rhizobium sp. PP-F2F-G36]TCQ23569.1 IclR family transcriptional regulator [Rhizobium sp. PP-CC-3G-465]